MLLINEQKMNNQLVITQKGANFSTLYHSKYYHFVVMTSNIQIFFLALQTTPFKTSDVFLLLLTEKKQCSLQ